MAYQGFLKDDSGAATIDWVVVMAVLVGLGVAVSETTDAALTTESSTIQGELQDGLFETAWDSQLAVQPDGEAGNNCTGGTSCDPGTTLWTGADTGTGNGTDPDPDPTPDPDPDPTPDPDPDPTPDPDPDPDPTPDPDPDPDPTPDPPTASPPAAGCPSTNYYGIPIVADGADLTNNSDYQVRYSAYTNLRSCSGLPRRWAHFDANPTFTLTLSGMASHDYLQLDVETANCDTTLLVRDAAGNYHFDDDGGRGLLSRLRIYDTDDLNGRVDVWLGVYSGGTCNAELEIRTG